VKILGIDPGVHGGMAIVSFDDGAAPQLVSATDIPTVGIKAAERVDVLAVRTWIETHRPDQAVIERGMALPKQGASSGFKYGRACGALEAVIALCGIPVRIVEPTQWKKFHGLRGKDKEAARALAIQKFPAAHALFARKKDHQRAEAALIALTPAPGVVAVARTESSSIVERQP
jgi:Holliday junction resolvasome RuvABC endonuclease subunit